MAKQKMKRCEGKGGCGKLFPATEEYFTKRFDRPGQFQSMCKKCMKEYQAQYEIDKRDSIKRRKAEYYALPEIKAHKKERQAEYNARPEIKARTKEQKAEYHARPEIKALIKKQKAEYYARPEIKAHVKERQAKHYEASRERCLDEYGHACVWEGCGITWSEFLAFDHPKNDGKKHKEITGLGNRFIGWLIRKGFPKGIVQILCHNHNWKKELQRKALLHKQTPRAIASRKSDAKLKLETMTAYGPNGVPMCSCPGCTVTDIDMLNLDHIDGVIDRSIPRGGDDLYRWLRQHGFPPGYRTLCANCNDAIGFYEYCPHDLERKHLEFGLVGLSLTSAV